MISLVLFLVLFVLSLFAEFIANDKPILVRYDGAFYMPIFTMYPETTFGGDFPTEADYADPAVRKLIDAKGWMIRPVIPWHHATVDYQLSVPAPAPPSARHWLGTDEQGRDLLSRLIYGFRISVLFGLLLTFFSSIIGVAAGAVQGYFGGWVDLGFQRFMEIWSGDPAPLRADHPRLLRRAQLLVAARHPAPVPLDVAGLRGARRVPARAPARLRARGTRARRTRPRHHVPPRAAERHGGGAHHAAVRAQFLDHGADLPRLPRPRPAAGRGVARRGTVGGQGQPAGAVDRDIAGSPCWR